MKMRTIMWIDKYLPTDCPLCGTNIQESNQYKDSSYFAHSECYWKHARPGSTPVFITHREIKTNPIKTPMLPCLSRVHKVELSDGCSHSCIYCYTYSKPRVNLPRGLVILRDNLVEKVDEQIIKMRFVKPIYLSPNCDPFQQPAKQITEMTRQLVELFIERGLSFYFVTKGVISDEVLNLINGYPFVDAQLTLVTANEEKRKLTEPNAPSITERLKNIENLVDSGVRPIQRIDPLLPYITDDAVDLEELLKVTIDLGVRHIVGSYIGMRQRIWNYMKNFFKVVGMENMIPKYEELFYGSKIPSIVHHFKLAPENYRYGKLKWLSEKIEKIGKGKVTFSTCLEDTHRSNLFHELWTSEMCEPIHLPIHKRVGKRFEPIMECVGCNLSNCTECPHLGHSQARNLLSFEQNKREL